MILINGYLLQLLEYIVFGGYFIIILNMTKILVYNMNHFGQNILSTNIWDMTFHSSII